jgi:hypothetical protein
MMIYAVELPEQLINQAHAPTMQIQLISSYRTKLLNKLTNLDRVSFAVHAHKQHHIGHINY